MRTKITVSMILLVILSMVASTVLIGCSTPAEEPTTSEDPAEPAEPAESEPVVNRAGVELPPDAAPLEEQVLRMASNEFTWMTWDASVYDENIGDMIAWADSCVYPDDNYELHYRTLFEQGI